MIVHLAFALHIFAIVTVLNSSGFYGYALVFFTLGAAMDGMRLAFSNLILIIAPEQKRPVYIALQSNLTSIGLFFSIPGAFVLQYFSYDVLYTITLLFLLVGLVYSLRLKISD